MSLHTSPQSSPALKKKVLVVDDDRFQLDAISEALHSLGVEDVTLSNSGDDAMGLLMADPRAYGLMLCDLQMPGMDGFQFMENVSKNGFSGPLIIVSGQSRDVLHSAALVAQLRRFSLLGILRKPVQRTALAELLSKIH
jgi:CheY-like chemotaxis protein